MSHSAIAPQSKAGWAHFPHDADVGVQGWGATVAEAFERAVHALTAVITHVEVRPQARVEVSEKLVKQLLPSTRMERRCPCDHAVQVEEQGLKAFQINDDHGGRYRSSSRPTRKTITGQTLSRITCRIVRARLGSSAPRQPRTMRSLSFCRAKSTIADPASP